MSAVHVESGAYEPAKERPTALSIRCFRRSSLA
jgi:hypothetical protein